MACKIDLAQLYHKKEWANMTREVTEFIIYIINEIANANGCSTSDVYRILESTGCISNYLVPFYDVIHTMSSESIVSDVMEFVQAKGARI